MWTAGTWLIDHTSYNDCWSISWQQCSSDVTYVIHRRRHCWCRTDCGNGNSTFSDIVHSQRVCVVHQSAFVDECDIYIECILFQNLICCNTSEKIWLSHAYLCCVAPSVYHRHREYSWSLWCLLVKEGMVCSALCTVRRRDTTPTTTRKICVFFFTGLDRSRMTSLDRSRLKKNATNVLLVFKAAVLC